MIKVGDKIKVLTDQYPGLTKGEIYEIYWVSVITSYRFSFTVKGSDTVRFYPAEGFELIEEQPDLVNKPAHYTNGNIECIDAIKSALTPEEFRGYCKGNLIKYTWREQLKNGVEDLEKAMVYLKWLIDELNNK